MKKNLTRALLLLLSLLLCFGLVACKTDENGTDPSSATLTETGDRESESESSEISPERTYVVRFEGEEVSIASQTVKANATAIEPKAPTRTGYDFIGWSVKETDEEFRFDQPITSDITLVARWRINNSETITGSGTVEDPYLILNAKQLVAFAERVNHPEDDEDPMFYAACFRLGADIDMSGIAYEPAGREIVIHAGTDEEKTVYGFSGSFDGAGYTIRNLSISKILRSGVWYAGLFGETYSATIQDLTLENYSVSVESYADLDSLGACIGGLVGYATLTNLENVSVSGAVDTNLLPKNTAYIGGIAGVLSSPSRGGTAYMLYVENCFADLTVKIDEEGCLDSAAVGGMFGYVSTSDGAISIINCKTSGTVLGGEWTGGIAAYLRGDNITIINCASDAKVQATAQSVSYAGGLVGSSFGDNLILDSFSTGSVTGTLATSSTYTSHAGGIIGYAAADDYTYYYSAGTAVVNCYYSGRLSKSDRYSTLGTKIAKTDITKTWTEEVLKWDSACWNYDEDGVPTVPSEILAHESNASCQLILKDGDTTVATFPKNFEGGLYGMVGNPDVLPNRAPNLFYDWELGDGVGYRFFMPVIKDTVLTARWQDVSAISHIYSGTATFHDAMDGGLIVLHDNGSVEWFTSNTTFGTYIYDGEHIIMDLDTYGEVCGTLVDGKLQFILDFGISGDVEYAFRVDDSVKYYGEYYSDAGDIITFGSAGSLSFHSAMIRGGDNVSANYTESGNQLTLSSRYLSDYFSAMTITVEDVNTLTVTFRAFGNNTYDLNQVTFRKLESPDYTGKSFVGEYTTLYTSYYASDETPSQDAYRILFNADGTATYSNSYSDKIARYYYFENGHIIKFTLEGYTSTFVYDEENNIFYGVLSRGYAQTKRPVVITPVADGDLKGYVIGSYETIVFVNDTNRYYIENGIYQPDAELTGTFENGTDVTVNGVRYRALYREKGGYSGYMLSLVGSEEGDYIYEGQTIHLDGLRTVSGSLSGIYQIYDNLVVVFCDDDSLVAFDCTKAREEGGVITVTQGDKYQGVWYMDDKGIEKYYKFVLDGFGHSAFQYYRTEDGVYRNNWGNDWGFYFETATGIHCWYNDSQSADVIFYYDMQLATSRKFCYLGNASFYADGYTGSMTAPTLPSEAVSAYSGLEGGNGVVLNIRNDGSGSYKGNPFSTMGIYDGDASFFFWCDGIGYAFNIHTLVLSEIDSGKTIQMSRAGATQDVIPGALTGTWSGLWFGYGISDKGEIRSVTINADGRVIYNGTPLSNCQYNGVTNVITATVGNSTTGSVLTLTYDTENHCFRASYRTLSDSMEWTADTLTKEE